MALGVRIRIADATMVSESVIIEMEELEALDAEIKKK